MCTKRNVYGCFRYSFNSFKLHIFNYNFTPKRSWLKSPWGVNFALLLLKHNTHTHTHTRSLYLSLPLSLSHTHTYSVLSLVFKTILNPWRVNNLIYSPLCISMVDKNFMYQWENSSYSSGTLRNERIKKQKSSRSNSTHLPLVFLPYIL